MNEKPVPKPVRPSPTQRPKKVVNLWELSPERQRLYLALIGHRGMRR